MLVIMMKCSVDGDDYNEGSDDDGDRSDFDDANEDNNGDDDSDEGNDGGYDDDDGEVASESTLRSAGTLLSQVQASPPAPWPDKGHENLRSPFCGLAIHKNQIKLSEWPIP
ncbi:hypothetical protein PoB_000942100 [Plakobranchus ocellatus]|uniref:Uncharacterized protein n=1 Tax=Plakobranchus ocellatus TaxID=259542 RepID=A0AAV3YKK4_9GAST|nr:hypothetical protein PoB_000942100 [Plakobranchus ocellatus]